MSLPVIRRPLAGTTRVSGSNKFCESFESAHAAAEPGAIAVIQEGPLLAGNHAAGDQHVHLWKMHIEIAVGVSRGQVAVVDLVPGKLQRAVAAESSYSVARLQAAGPSGLRKLPK